MPRRDRDDDYAQVDGEQPFATSMHAQPWVQMGGLTPWHMWGNQQTIVVPGSGNEEPVVVTPGQLARLAYRRPESWHWAFVARIAGVSGNYVPDPANRIETLTIDFDLVIGHGRTSSILQGFDRFRWMWFPVTQGIQFAHVMWAMSALTPPLDYVITPPPPAPATGVSPDPASRRVIPQLVTEDLQCNVRCTWAIAGFNEEDGRPSLNVEVAAYFAPKTHIRPDWLQSGVPPEAKFPGEEIRGR